MDEILNIWREMLADEVVAGKREILQRFFKTAPGEYGEGDVFIGVTVPCVRKVAKLMADAPIEAIRLMLSSEVHEHRLSALLVLVEQYQRARKQQRRNKNAEIREGFAEECKKIVDFYLANARRCNNWDLVDLTAPKILGDYVAESGRTEILYDLSCSEDLWEQRMAIVATYTLLCRGVTDPTVEIATAYLTHGHDLIHKATGWMLREMGKRVSEKRLTEFLDRYAPQMPRTMLRYAIEKLPGDVRRHYLAIPRKT